MSRIYHNQPLTSVPITSHKWTKKWDPKTFQRGDGVLVEGSVHSRTRHVVEDSDQQKFRYVVFHIRPNRSHRRQFDGSGKEIEPNFSETQKVRTGYLHSSYKVESKGQTDKLSDSELTQTVISPELSSFASAPAGAVSFWISEEHLTALEILEGDAVRLRTQGNSPFIENIAKIDVQSSTAANFAGGENVGGSWTDKVMSVKQTGQSAALPQDQNEGVDEDEWDD